MTADEQLNKLGFTKDSETQNVITYIIKPSKYFNGYSRNIPRIRFFNKRKVWSYNFAELNLDLTNAILEKIKELDW